jgi:plasmid replication initiation protein
MNTINRHLFKTNFSNTEIGNKAGIVIYDNYFDFYEYLDQENGDNLVLTSENNNLDELEFALEKIN